MDPEELATTREPQEAPIWSQDDHPEIPGGIGVGLDWSITRSIARFPCDSTALIHFCPYFIHSFILYLANKRATLGLQACFASEAVTSICVRCWKVLRRVSVFPGN